MIARALAIGLALALLLAGWQWTRATQARVQLAEVRADLDRQVRSAEQAARAIEFRRVMRLQEASDAAHLALTAAQADARAAGLAADRLRQRTQALATAARCPAADPAAAPGGPPANAPADLLAELFTRLDERAGELARYADQARIAGIACERAYGSLSPQ